MCDSGTTQPNPITTTPKARTRKTSRRSGTTWRYDSFHVLLARETELNPIYSEDERPLLQKLYRGEPPCTEEAPARCLVEAA